VSEKSPASAAREARDPTVLLPRAGEARAATVPLRRDAPTGEPLLEAPVGRLLQDWKGAHARAVAYLAALEVPEDERDALAREAVARAFTSEPWEATSEAIEVTLRALRDVLAERFPATPRPWDAAMDDFLAWRLDAALSGCFAPDETARALTTLPAHDDRFAPAPKLTRGAMVPERSERRVLRRLLDRLRGKRSASVQARRELRRRRRRLPWTRVAARRRMLLATLVLLPSIVASGFMVNVLPHQGGTRLEVAIVLVFGALFGWISIGFWTALLGFWCLIGRRDRFAVTHADAGEPPCELPHDARTAIVMPICDEPTERVFAGLRAIHRSLERIGALRHFHFFVLSDTSDPGTTVKEEAGWFAWCRAADGFDRIFYRRRRVRLRRKSGNVADFCRRWGKQYRYVIMLDADSIMAGETLVRLVRLMERHPDAGMIQTIPAAVNRRSLFARVQQFASRVYGPMFAAGLHYWQLGDGQYWGHNAIIRVAPFMAHCGLPRLSGKPPLGGEILSHDFVEAALMGRAGWTLWLAYDLPGSYEEVPSTLLEEMKRDRRWCQGNLQHLRLLFTEGLFGAHRALFLNGVLSYVSAVLWFAFLSLSTAEAILNALAEPDYFPSGPSLFPAWPVWRPNWALSLLAVTAMILFLPKLLSVLLIVGKRQAAAFGGASRVMLSVVLEILLSSLFAPIRMVFHSRFVVTNLLGRTVPWRSQRRGDAETSWAEAMRHHGFDTLFASAWGVSLYWLNPGYFWWVTPIIVALILSVPLSVFASRVDLGDRAAARRLFLTPEETAPATELRDLADILSRAQEAPSRGDPEGDGFVHATVDPYANAVHHALLGMPRSLAPGIRAARRALLERGVTQGPAALDAGERKVLLVDPAMMDELHRRVWQQPERERAGRWGRPGRSSGA
jgi:membrane glycosyltransferase